MIYITLFTIFVLYTLACIADGPDIKPILNIKIGNYLHKQADKFYHAHYCKIDYCPFVHNYIGQSIREAHPAIEVTGYDMEIIKHTAKINEEEAYYFKTRQNNINIIDQAKYICRAAIEKAISSRITYNIDDDNPEGCIYVTGNIVVEKNDRRHKRV